MKRRLKRPSQLEKDVPAQFLTGERACLPITITFILLKFPSVTILLVQQTPIRQNSMLLNHLFSHLSGSRRNHQTLTLCPRQTQPMNQLDNCLTLLYILLPPPPYIWVIILIAFKPPFPKFFSIYLREREQDDNRSEQSIPTEPLSVYLVNPKYTFLVCNK